MVSIHAPHAGRDVDGNASDAGYSSFNPRAPCGARPALPFPRRPYRVFQSTRPMRGATNAATVLLDGYEFQSTRPVRGATAVVRVFLRAGIVSIHAPRAGRDTMPRIKSSMMRSFNPRAPCGARPDRSSEGVAACRFQSTRPVRGATPLPPCRAVSVIVSIHAPRAGRDALV